MPRAPKPPDRRARRNKKAEAAVLKPNPNGKAPPLPRSTPTGKRWLKRTRDWWARIWRSPMAARWLESDIEGLYVLAGVYDEFWRGEIALAAEIRLQRRAFGLSPEDRNRLDWRLSDPASDADGEEASPPAATARRARRRPADDPRRALSVVR